MGNWFVSALVLCTATVLTAFSRLQIEAEQARVVEDSTQEVLYLPNGEALHFISFGYSNALAQLLWFNTVSYFGKHYQRDQNYQWLQHYCELVVSLNPQMTHAYVFCAQMLAWEVKQPHSAQSLLSKGISNLPQDWYLRYLRGFNASYFLQDINQAKSDFVAASKLPHAPVMVARLAAKTIAELESPATAIEFLEESLSRTSDPAARDVLRSKLVKLQKTQERRAP